jgi:hypothetical protein
MTGRLLVASNAGKAALVATFIATFASLLVYLTDYRYRGSDISQSLLSEFPGGPLGPGAGHGRAAPAAPGAISPPTNWIFLDLGPRFCAPGEDGILPSCPPEARTDPLRLARLIGWVARAAPRVLVVDVNVVRTRAELRVLEVSLAALPVRVPIVIALPIEGARLSGPAGDPVIGVSEETAALLELRQGSTIRLLPATIWPSSPVSRRLMPDVRVVGAGPLRRVPTLSFGAALVAVAPPQAPFADVDQFAAATDAGAGSGTCAHLTAPRCAADFRASERVFSFPVVPPADGEEDAEAERHSAEQFLYLYLPAPRTAEVGLPPADIRDAVVVIGDSRGAAEDHHFTALGEADGAEIVLNDIRQFVASQPVPAGGLGSYMWNELPYLGLGFLAVSSIEGVRSHRRTRRPRPKRKAFLNLLSGIGQLLVISSLTAVLFVLYLLVGGRHGPPDFVTPFATLLLGSAIELLFRMIRPLEARKGSGHAT